MSIGAIVDTIIDIGAGIVGLATLPLSLPIAAFTGFDPFGLANIPLVGSLIPTFDTSASSLDVKTDKKSKPKTSDITSGAPSGKKGQKKNKKATVIVNEGTDDGDFLIPRNLLAKDTSEGFDLIPAEIQRELDKTQADFDALGDIPESKLEFADVAIQVKSSDDGDFLIPRELLNAKDSFVDTSGDLLLTTGQVTFEQATTGNKVQTFKVTNKTAARPKGGGPALSIDIDLSDRDAIISNVRSAIDLVDNPTPVGVAVEVGQRIKFGDNVVTSTAENAAEATAGFVDGFLGTGATGEVLNFGAGALDIADRVSNIAFENTFLNNFPGLLVAKSIADKDRNEKITKDATKLFGF